AGPQGPAGPAGAAGAKGDKGDTGQTGSRGPSFGDSKFANSVAVASCGTDSTTMTLPVTLAAPSRIYASATSFYSRTDPGAQLPSLTIQLVSGTTIVASTPRNFSTSAAG